MQVVQKQGFAWINDITSVTENRWGWVSEHIGDFLEVQVRQDFGSSCKVYSTFLPVVYLLLHMQ